MLSFDEYNHGAARTERYNVKDWRQGIPINVYRSLHGVLGLHSEISELTQALKEAQTENGLDETNLVEEIGDLWWYAALLHRLCFGLPGRPATVRIFAVQARFDLAIARLEMANLNALVGEGADLCKRTLFYGKQLDTQLLRVDDILEGLQRLTMACGVDLQEVWKVNIAKLWVRFPDEFTGEMAINRDTLKELEAMVELRRQMKAAKG